MQRYQRVVTNKIGSSARRLKLERGQQQRQWEAPMSELETESETETEQSRAICIGSVPSYTLFSLKYYHSCRLSLSSDAVTVF